MKNRSGAYLYGIVPMRVGAIPDCAGIGSPPLEVYAVPAGGVSVLVSYLPSNFPELSLEDAINHVKVLEKVMEEMAVIPIRFGTVAESLEELKGLLTAKKDEILKELDRLDGKYEVGVKAYWRKEYVLQEMACRFKDHAALAARIQKDMEAAIVIGQRIEELVEELRGRLTRELHPLLSRSAADNSLGEPMSVEMLYNASFLVSRQQDKALEQMVHEAAQKYPESIEFHYTTKLPPYNFVTLELAWGGKK